MSGWARYYDERNETMPPAWTRRLEDELLAEQVTLCYERAPFYQRKLDEAGVRPEQIEGRADLVRLPFTTGEELRESQAANPPFGEFLCADELDVVRVRLSQDTTAGPAVMAYTAADAAISAEVGARAFWAGGIRPDDVVVHCSPFADRAALEATGAATISVAFAEAGPLLASWAELRPNALVATMPFLLELAEAARGRGLEPRSLGLRKIVVTGAASEWILGARTRLDEDWHADVRGSGGVAEVWETFAAECEERQGLHFLGHGATLVEIVDPESGEPREPEPGAEGELVLTHLEREATPLLRFRSGTLVEVTAVECACGRTGFRFRYLSARGQEEESRPDSA